MATARGDYRVKFVSEEALEESALNWRRLAGNENDSYFNIVAFVERVLMPNVKDKFKIEFFNARPGEKPARVEFSPRTLFIDEEVWHLAEQGSPTDRHIVAHEIGHLIFHDGDAKAFSDDPEERVKTWDVRESAEWQANTFASYFLLPTRLVTAYTDTNDLKERCAVPGNVAEQRMSEVQEMSRPRVIRNGSLCLRCGNFTLDAGHCRSSECTSPRGARA